MCGCTNVGWLTRLAASDQHCCRYTSAASGQNPVDGQWGSRRDTRNENGEKKLKRWWLTSRTRKENQVKDGKRRNQEMESLALAATHSTKKKRKEGKVEKERECPRRGKKKELTAGSEWLTQLHRHFIILLQSGAVNGREICGDLSFYTSCGLFCADQHHTRRMYLCTCKGHPFFFFLPFQTISKMPIRETATRHIRLPTSAPESLKHGPYTYFRTSVSYSYTIPPPSSQ